MHFKVRHLVFIVLSLHHTQSASFELHSDGHKQKYRDEAGGNRTKENGNYSPQPHLSPFVCDHQSVIQNYPVD